MIRNTACALLLALPVAGQDVVAGLLADDRAVREKAVAELGELRPDLAVAVARLKELVAERPERAEPQGLVGAFQEFSVRLVDDAQLAKRAQGLQSEDASVRRESVVSLCRVGESAAEYRDDVLALITDSDADVRAAVAKNVSRLGWDQQVREVVLGALKDDTAFVRKAAAEGLAGHDDAGIVAALRGVLQDPDVDVRAAAVRAIGKSGAAGNAARADLLATLRDRERKVVEATLVAVRTLGWKDPAAVQATARCLAHADRRVLAQALRALGPMGEEAAPAVGTIVELSTHERSEVRLQVVSALWLVTRGEDPAALLALVEALQDDDKKVRARAESHLRELLVR